MNKRSTGRWPGSGKDVCACACVHTQPQQRAQALEPDRAPTSAPAWNGHKPGQVIGLRECPVFGTFSFFMPETAWLGGCFTTTYKWGVLGFQEGWESLARPSPSKQKSRWWVEPPARDPPASGAGLLLPGLASPHAWTCPLTYSSSVPGCAPLTFLRPLSMWKSQGVCSWALPFE